jgi:hypothetical protein
MRISSTNLEGHERTTYDEPVELPLGTLWQALCEHVGVRA